MALTDAPEKADKPAWPAALPDQIAGVREALQGLGETSLEQVARHFKRGRAKTVEPLLETLAAFGQACKLGMDGSHAEVYSDTPSTNWENSFSNALRCGLPLL